MIDEDVLPIGAATHAAIAERYLIEHGWSEVISPSLCS
jgi:IAA-amino acid hydrolase